MDRSFAQIRLPLQAAALALALSGCASMPPPTGELDAAQRAVARAGSADADQYAADAIAAARAELLQAQDALQRGRDDDARRLALAAAADADLGTALSHEAVANAELAQRRVEVAELQRRLRTPPPPAPVAPSPAPEPVFEPVAPPPADEDGGGR